MIRSDVTLASARAMMESMRRASFALLTLSLSACRPEPPSAVPTEQQRVVLVAPASAGPADAGALDVEPDVAEAEEPEVAADAPFHLAAVDREADWKNAPKFRPCAVRGGTTFLCGVSRLHVARGAGALGLDPGASNGLPRLPSGELDGVVHDVLGRFPDDAWLLLSLKEGCSECTFVAYRWKDAAWSEAGRFEITAHPSGIALWHGTLVGLHHEGASTGRELRWLAGKKRPLPPLSTKSSCDGGGLAPFALASDGASLFIGGVPCGTTWGFGVERAVAGRPSSTLDVVRPASTSASRSWARNRHAAFVGSANAPSTAGFVARFDGTRWETVTPLPRTENVFAYARAGAVEWLLTEGGETRKGVTRALWTRTNDGAWKARTDWRAAVPARYGMITEVVALEVANGSAWLTVTTESKKGCAGIQGCPQHTLVLRTGPAEPVVEL